MLHRAISPLALNLHSDLIATSHPSSRPRSQHQSAVFFPRAHPPHLTVPYRTVLYGILPYRYQASVQQLSVQELQELLGSPALVEDAQLVDVREEWEWQTARLPGFQLLPLSGFEGWGADIRSRLDPEQETVVLCHHGVRSMQMAQVRGCPVRGKAERRRKRSAPRWRLRAAG